MSPEYLEDATHVVCNMSFQQVLPRWSNSEPCYSEMTFFLSQQSTSDWESRIKRTYFILCEDFILYVHGVLSYYYQMKQYWIFNRLLIYLA